MATLLDIPVQAASQVASTARNLAAHAHSSNQVGQSNPTIAMTITVNAEARRIFQALTLPEYLETWVTFPDQSAESSIAASQLTDGYRLDQRSGGRVNLSITGSFLFCHHRKMRLCWRKTTCLNQTQPTQANATANTVVDFRLRGNFGSSVLELRHNEFNTLEEFLWHDRLWRNSLPKLASLLRSES
jgi:hypothetical protein